MTPEEVHTKLAYAVTRWDRLAAERAARRRGGYHNPYAIGQLLTRTDEVAADIKAGATPRAAIIAGFTEPVRNACLRAIGEPKITPEEDRNEELRPWTQGYTPASERAS